MGVAEPYEKLKALTRGAGGIERETLHEFIATLQIPDDAKTRLLKYDAGELYRFRGARGGVFMLREKYTERVAREFVRFVRIHLTVTVGTVLIRIGVKNTKTFCLMKIFGTDFAPNIKRNRLHFSRHSRTIYFLHAQAWLEK